MKNIKSLLLTFLTEEESNKAIEKNNFIVYDAETYINSYKKFAAEDDRFDYNMHRTIKAIESATEHSHIMRHDIDVAFYNGIKYCVMWF